MFKKTIVIAGNIIIEANVRYGTRNILLIHGLGCSKEIFDGAFNRPEFRNFGLVAPDLPGFGASSKAEFISYDLTAQANYLYQLLLKLNIQNPIIVAHSMGGTIGLLLTKMLNSVEHLFVLEGNLLYEDCTTSITASSMKENDFLKNHFEQMQRKCPTNFFGGNKDELKLMAKAYYKSTVSLVDLCRNGKLLPDYLALNSNKTYIYGSQGSRRKTISLLANQHTVNIHAAGHFMMLERPDATYHAIWSELK